MVIGSMAPEKANDFSIFISCWKIEAGAYLTINKIPETFPSTRFGVEVSKFHV